MIYITGDIHRNPIRFSSRFFPEGKDMTKDDYVIVCGDFGLIWDYEGESSEENYWLNWLDNKPWTTLFVPGNHENYDRLYGIDDPALLKCWLYDSLTESQKDNLYTGYPEKGWHDGMVRELRPSVLMLERVYIFNLCGKKFFSFGGASSHDIADGILHPEYLASKAEMNKIAAIAHNGYARTINLVHTSMDGDSIYAMSVGNVQADMDMVGTLAANVMGHAVCDAVRKATDAYGLISMTTFAKGV